MTNSLGHTLEIKHDRIDPIILSAIKAVNAIARAQGIPYVLAGATARELILRNVFGRPPGRRTLDVDFAVAVHDWAQFEGMKNALVQSGLFQPDPKHLQRVRHPGAAETVIVDLIPFGDIETAERTIAWPPKGDTIMHVAGFVASLLRQGSACRLSGTVAIPNPPGAIWAHLRRVTGVIIPRFPPRR